MHHDLQIETERLVLIACALEVADALTRDRSDAERLLGARLPTSWPDGELAEFLPIYAAYLREHPDARGYGVWLLVDRENDTVVGSSGFRGFPSADGEIEIGYGVDPAYQNRGYATEAVRALVAWGLAQPGVTQVAAHCDPANIASLRVVAKAGLTEAGERDGLTRWLSTH